MLYGKFKAVIGKDGVQQELLCFSFFFTFTWALKRLSFVQLK